MGINLLDAATEVDRVLGNREGAPFTNAKVWVKRAHQLVTLGKKFPEGEVTAVDVISAATNTVDKPADFYSILTLKDTDNNQKLIQVSNQRYDAFDISQIGPALYYTLGTTTFNVWRQPIVDTNVFIRYRKLFADMTADIHTTGLLTVWDEIVVLMALSLGHIDFDDVERSRDCRNDAVQLARNVNDQLVGDLDDRDEPVQVIGLYGDGV